MAPSDVSLYLNHRGGCALIDRSEVCDCGMEDARDLLATMLAALEACYVLLARDVLSQERRVAAEAARAAIAKARGGT